MFDFINYDFIIKNILLACLVPSGTGNPVHKDRPSHGLAINIHGEKDYHFSDGQTLTVKENDIIYLPKHSTYNVSTKVSGDCYAINFDTAEQINFAPFVINIKNYNTVISSFHIAQKVWKQKSSGYVIKCRAELYNIIYAMQQEYFSRYIPKNKSAIIKPAVDYIHEKHTDEVIKVDTLARICNISPEYLRRIFKTVYGVSPIIYINSLKIARAKELLKSQLYSISEVASLSGFSEVSCFSREFKKTTGISPSEFKKSTQQ